MLLWKVSWTEMRWTEKDCFVGNIWYDRKSHKNTAPYCSTLWTVLAWLCRWGWPWTYGHPPDSASWILGWQACATMTNKRVFTLVAWNRKAQILGPQRKKQRNLLLVTLLLSDTNRKLFHSLVNVPEWQFWKKRCWFQARKILWDDGRQQNSSSSLSAS